MAKKTLEEQLDRRQELQQQLTAGLENQPAAQTEQPSEASAEQPAEQSGAEAEDVSGYKMEKVTNEEETTELTSSGVQWLASLCVFLVLAVVAGGIWWQRRQRL